MAQLPLRRGVKRPAKCPTYINGLCSIANFLPITATACSQAVQHSYHQKITRPCISDMFTPATFIFLSLLSLAANARFLQRDDGSVNGIPYCNPVEDVGCGSGENPCCINAGRYATCQHSTSNPFDSSGKWRYVDCSSGQHCNMNGYDAWCADNV